MSAIAPRPTPKKPARWRHARWPMAFVGLLLVAVSGWWLTRDAVGTQPPAGHPSEPAARQLGKKVMQRFVVRTDAGGFDVWMISNAPFKRLAERAQFVAAGSVQLRGGYRLDGVQKNERDRSIRARLLGSSPVNISMVPQSDGSLLILHGAGSAAEAPPWAPPYRPLPLDLPHGPVR